MATPLCGARTRNGKTCKHEAGWYTDHFGSGRCKMHGGNTPNGKKGAVEDGARLILARLDVEPVADPLAELSKLAGQVCAWRDAIAGKVNELLDIRYSQDSGEQLRAEVAVYERAMDRCTTILTAMAKLNIDERLAKISERQAQLVEAAVLAAIAAAGLDGEQTRVFQATLTQQIRELA